MSSAPLPYAAHSETNELTREEWWKLFHELRVKMAPLYDEFGGPVAFFRAERDAHED